MKAMPRYALMTVATSVATVAAPAAGPLRVQPDNPRYFADASGHIVYLTGAHTWSNLKDMGPSDPPAAFDYPAYLDFLTRHHHNFMRLWTWELSRYSYGGRTTYASPFPWLRTGPGEARDGKPRFDLTRCDESYFERLRSRVVAAGECGIYVSIMLFEGHGLHASDPPWCWDGHPFNAANNVNGIDGDPNGDGRGIESQSLVLPAVARIQEAYVRKVIDTVNDLDNVLYEIANESGAYSTKWQYHFIDFIHAYERSKPKQHPVGMTFQYCRDRSQRGTNAALFASPADWISPNPDGGYRDHPPAADGRKVVISDTDHLWGIGGNVPWVWQSFCRGLNPIFMDPYNRPEKREAKAGGNTWTDHLGGAPRVDPKWETLRRALGDTARLAERLDLRRALPLGKLASSGYCLAVPGEWFVVYAPKGGALTVDLAAAKGDFSVEWQSPDKGRWETAAPIHGGAKRELTAPFSGHAVLLLQRTAPPAP